VRSLAQLSGDRLLLLSGDKAYSQAQDLIAPWGLGLVLHDGCFSMTVNFHALGQYVTRRGGRFLQTAHHHDSLNICAFLLGHPPGDFAETRLAYETAIEQGGPDDFFTLRSALEAHSEDLTLPQVLAYLRLSGWDAEIMGFCLTAIVKQLDQASPPEREELYWAIQQVWDGYYPIGEDNDLALNLATLLFALGYYRDALGYIQHSLRLRGPDAGVIHNAGMCHYYLRELDTALECFNQALALDPALATARAMRIKVEAELERQAR
jgi:tetratricopeptide (TPR) repeat protein